MPNHAQTKRRDTSDADAISMGTQTLLRELGWECLSEVTLSNSRRVDLMGINRKGEIIVVEVKSSLTDYQTDTKWEEYLDFCDYFYFAVNGEFPIDRLPESVGKIISDKFGGAIILDSQLSKLNGARRRSLTLKFARLAAKRLNKQLNGRLA